MDVLVFSTRYVYLRGVYNGFFLKVSLGWMNVVESAIYSVVGYFDIAALWNFAAICNGSGGFGKVPVSFMIYWKFFYNSQYHLINDIP